MTWERCFAAILALGDASLKMRAPGDWYVSQSNVEVKEAGASVISFPVGNGADPERAVLNYFGELTSLKPKEYVVIGALGSKRRAVRWNGFMWADIDEARR